MRKLIEVEVRRLIEVKVHKLIWLTKMTNQNSQHFRTLCGRNIYISLGILTGYASTRHHSAFRNAINSTLTAVISAY